MHAYPETEHGTQNYPSAPSEPEEHPWVPDPAEREHVRQIRRDQERREEIRRATQR